MILVMLEIGTRKLLLSIFFRLEVAATCLQGNRLYNLVKEIEAKPLA